MDIKKVKLYQLIQETRERYVIRIVPSDDTAPTDDDLFLDDLRDLLGGESAEIIVEIVNDIPTTNSQKRRYTVNLYRPQ